MQQAVDESSMSRRMVGVNHALTDITVADDVPVALGCDVKCSLGQLFDQKFLQYDSATSVHMHSTHPCRVLPTALCRKSVLLKSSQCVECWETPWHQGARMCSCYSSGP